MKIWSRMKIYFKWSTSADPAYTGLSRGLCLLESGHWSTRRHLKPKGQRILALSTQCWFCRHAECKQYGVVRLPKSKPGRLGNARVRTPAGGPWEGNLELRMDQAPPDNYRCQECGMPVKGSHQQSALPFLYPYGIQSLYGWELIPLLTWQTMGLRVYSIVLCHLYIN